MKIGNSPETIAASTAGGAERSATTDAGRKAAAQTSGATTGSSSAPQASAQIALSSTASKLLSGVPDEGSFDAAKVDRISQAIADGKYTVNADAVADKLIANAQEMLGRTSAAH